MQSAEDYRKVPEYIKKQRRLYYIIAAVIAGVYVLATVHTRFNPFEIFFKGENFVDFLVNDLLPPNFARANNIGVWQALVQSISMAFLATFVGGIISFCLCFFASFQTSPSPHLVKIVRGMASLQRNIPNTIWFFIFRTAFGIGVTIGFIALLLNTVGSLTRMFAEVVDEVGKESMEALDSVGAGYFSKLFQCVIPAAIPGFVSWLLFALEGNILASGIVGALGGGGIGMLLNGYLSAFLYRTAVAVILILASATIAISLVTDYLRKKVLKS
ncbi:MAG: ABC transporter permease subunit [Oscillospiraceae bacterium]|nr:ABC transporter permease subunit [Oscillospiraceae bacterium]